MLTARILLDHPVDEHVRIVDGMDRYDVCIRANDAYDPSNDPVRCVSCFLVSYCVDRLRINSTRETVKDEWPLVPMPIYLDACLVCCTSAKMDLLLTNMRYIAVFRLLFTQDKYAVVISSYDRGIYPLATRETHPVFNMFG